MTGTCAIQVRPTFAFDTRLLFAFRYAVVLISNQALRAGALEDWKKKIPLIASAVCHLSFLVSLPPPDTAKSCQMFRSAYLLRVPRTGTGSRCLACGTSSNASSKSNISTLVRTPAAHVHEAQKMMPHTHTDKKAAFFVGDAAGRADDFASTDRKWAINIGIPFHTPEVNPYLLLVSLGGAHVTPRITGRSTFLGFQRLPTNSPDSTYLVSQRVRCAHSTCVRILMVLLLSDGSS